jgi:hypothetical protein
VSRPRHTERSRRGERPRELEAILARKRELIERAAGQREAIAVHAAGLAPVFAAGDRVVKVGRSLLAHPILLAGAGAVVVVLWPRAVLGLAVRAFAAWNGARALRRMLNPSG